MSKISGASIISRMLQGYGVTHVFYVPTILMRSLAEMDSLKIKKILTHSEKAAAYMADGYARASGKPGLCLAQQIGATNLLSGLRDAFMANSPVIAITGGSTNDSKYRNAYQEVEEFKQFDSMTKFNAEVNDTNRLPDLIRQSFRVATTGSPGPVHLRLMGLHGGTIADAVTDADISIEEKFKFSPPFRPVAHLDDINQAIELLLKAERPIIVAGGDDDLSPIDHSYKLYDEITAPKTLVVYKNELHGVSDNLDVRALMADWMTDRFADKPLVSRCIHRDCRTGKEVNP